MKRIIALLTAVLMAAAVFAGCGSSETKKKTDSAASQQAASSVDLNAVVDNLPAGIYTYGIMGSNTMQKLIVK